MDLHVIKRDGSHQPFEMGKIKQVMRAAGLTDKQTNNIVQQITGWVTSISGKTVTSLQIRDKLLEVLPGINQQSANLFAWYQKTKEK